MLLENEEESTTKVQLIKGENENNELHTLYDAVAMARKYHTKWNGLLLPLILSPVEGSAITPCQNISISEVYLQKFEAELS